MKLTIADYDMDLEIGDDDFVADVMVIARIVDPKRVGQDAISVSTTEHTTGTMQRGMIGMLTDSFNDLEG